MAYPISPRRQPNAASPAPAPLSQRTRQCLTVDSSANGAPVVQRPGDGSTKQRWSWVWQPDGDDPRFANIRNQYSGLDLNVAGGSGAYGAKLIQWPHVPHTLNALFTFAAKESVD
jgi:ricin-type beta-trefoil lectin protein